MPDAGANLNKRVWQLFERAGFVTKPNADDPLGEEQVPIPGRDPRTVDLSATVSDLHVKIIGENTTSARLQKSFTFYANDLKTLMGISGADAGLLVYTRYEPLDEDHSYAKTLGIRVWEDKEVRYYETLADTIGEYAKYEIIDSFGLETEEERHDYSVWALRVNQPTSTGPASLYLFSIPPGKLLRTAAVLRKARGEAAAYQRMLNKERLPNILAFVTGANALLPTNIILSLNDDVRWEPLRRENLRDEQNVQIRPARLDCEVGLLRIPLRYASLELIDGQHRLFGFVKADAATLEEFNLVALGIKGLSPDLRRDAFVKINDKARRVDPNLVAFLRYTDDERTCQGNAELMAIKIAFELNKSGPLKGKIRMLDIGDQIITLKGLSGYDLKSLVGDRGWLRRCYMNSSTEYVPVLKTYFETIVDLFPEEWADPRKYIIFTNRGVSAFLKLLRSMLRTKNQRRRTNFERLDEPTIRMYLEALRDAKSDPQDWEFARLKSAYTGQKGWSDFHKDLVKAVRRRYRNFDRPRQR